MSTLQTTVTAGPAGPVIALAGEADVSTTEELRQLLAAQTDAGTAHLTVDLSGLRFADSAAIWSLIEAHRALRKRGGTLELLRPQPAVARTLSLLGVDQILAVRNEAGTAGTGPGGGRAPSALPGRTVNWLPGPGNRHHDPECDRQLVKRGHPAAQVPGRLFGDIHGCHEARLADPAIPLPEV